jgi:diguanylate cyclase (GGDEF)-like protein
MSELAQLETIRARRSYGQAFPAELEAKFRDTQRRRHRIGRTLTFAIQGIAIALAPFYGNLLFAPDPSIIPWLALGTTAMGLLLFTTAWATFRSHAAGLTQRYQAVSVIATAWGALYLRYLSLLGLMDWPPEVISLIVASSSIFGGYRWRRMAVGALFCFVVAAVMQLELQGWNRRSAVEVFSLAFMGLIVILGVYGHELISRVAWINHRYAEALARTDPLTGLSTRAEFNRVFASRLAQARRDQRCVAVLLFDIDHFKSVNDTYGHLFGDEVLHSVGRLIRTEFARRPLDLRVRFGGEEIAILWYDIDESQIPDIAERLLEAVRRLELREPGSGVTVPITASVGVTWLRPRDGVTPVTLLRYADELLYQAKRQGRNQAVAHGYYEHRDGSAQLQ